MPFDLGPFEKVVGPLFSLGQARTGEVAKQSLVQRGLPSAQQFTGAVSAVIVTTGLTPFLWDAVNSVLKCDPFEVIVVSRAEVDDPPNLRNVKIKVAPGLNISAARNLAISLSRGEILAFTDDDCTVDEDWLTRGTAYFQDERIAMVGGPGVTHPDDPVMSKCAGAVLASRVGTLSSSYRYFAGSAKVFEAKEVNVSACNLFLRRAVLQAIGYFDEVVQPCEENELIERIRSSGGKCLYSSECVVYHHRRPLLRPFLKQISFYAYGRALFVVRQPKRFRFVNAAPSVLVITTLLSPFLWVALPSIIPFLLAGSVAYLTVSLLGAAMSALKSGLPRRHVATVWLGIMAMHYCYGAAFLLGLGKFLWPRR